MQELHPQLCKDCHLLGNWESSQLLLHKNAALHWLILVPETTLLDWLELPEDHLQLTLRQATQLVRFLKKELKYTRVNFATIGNLTPQMHLHIVGRHENDACWPAPVWGNLNSPVKYTPEEIVQLQQLLRERGLLSS